MAQKGVVGAILAAERMRQDYELSDISRRLGASVERLRVLETGDYEQLAHDVYADGLVRSYAEVLGLDAEPLLAQYYKERGELASPARHKRRKKPGVRPIVTMQLGLKLIGAIALLIALAYIGLQTLTLTGDPALNIIFPKDNQVIYGQEVEIIGTTDPNTEIYIDSTLATVSDNGDFQVTLHLSPGIHTITIEARNRLGRSTTRERTVIVRESLTDLPESLQ